MNSATRLGYKMLQFKKANKVILIISVVTLSLVGVGFPNLTPNSDVGNNFSSTTLVIVGSSPEVVEASNYLVSHLTIQQIDRVYDSENLLIVAKEIRTNTAIYVSHGSQSGMQVGLKVISWNEVLETSEMNTAETQIFVSCDSRNVKNIPSRKINIGFDGEIDSFSAAVFTSAFVLAQNLQFSTQMEKVMIDMRSDYLKKRMSIDSHPLSMQYFTLVVQDLYIGAGYYENRFTFVGSRYTSSYWAGVSGTWYITKPGSGYSTELFYGDLISAADAAQYLIFTWWLPWTHNHIVDTWRGYSATQRTHLYWAALVMDALMGWLAFDVPWQLTAVAIIYNALSAFISPLIHLIGDAIIANPSLASLLDGALNLLGVGTLVMSLVLTYICLWG
ncbi:MAG: hypothetical protein ACFFD1_08275 [Candidatus Thorarchaeota archaeon]